MKITKKYLQQIIREEVQRAKALPRLSEQEEKSLVKDLNDRVAKIEKDLDKLIYSLSGLEGLVNDTIDLYDGQKDVKMRLDTLETLVDAPKKAKKNVPD